MKSKLAKYLDPLLEFPSSDKYHWWFYLMLNPRYINESIDVRKLHEIDTVDTRTIINEMMLNFYDYIVSAELVENTYKAPHAVDTANLSLYFDEETVG